MIQGARMKTNQPDSKVIALTDDDENVRNALERTILKNFDNITENNFRQLWN